MTEQFYAVIKLISGDEVFGKIDDNIDENSPILVVEDPLVEEEYLNDDGSSTVVMKKYCMATHETKVAIVKNSIISLTTMSEPFSEYYRASIEISHISAEAYDAKITDLASKMFHHINILASDGGDLTYMRTDTDTIH